MKYESERLFGEFMFDSATYTDGVFINTSVVIYLIFFCSEICIVQNEQNRTRIGDTNADIIEFSNKNANSNVI